MSKYEEYCAAIQLVTDGPGTHEREREAIAAEGRDELDAALRRDREVQARWSDCDRGSREVGMRIRKLSDFVGATQDAYAPPAAPWYLDRIESELAAMEKDVQQLESAMDWVNRARRQVSAELGKIQ